MRKFTLRTGVAIWAATLLAAPAFAGGHISSSSGSGSSSVSIDAGPGGSLSMSVSNGDRTIDINSGALGAGSGVGRADAATEGLGSISVQNFSGQAEGGPLPAPCSLSQNASVCD